MKRKFSKRRKPAPRLQYTVQVDVILDKKSIVDNNRMHIKTI